MSLMPKSGDANLNRALLSQEGFGFLQMLYARIGVKRGISLACPRVRLEKIPVSVGNSLGIPERVLGRWQVRHAPLSFPSAFCSG
jgi:hypothetical protein